MQEAVLLRQNTTGSEPEILISDLMVTERMTERMRGLLGRSPLTMSQGMLIHPCNSVHTFFMGYPLDLVYIDKHQRVCHQVEKVNPWRVSGALKAAGVIELAAGQIRHHNIQVGDQLAWRAG